MPDETVPPIFPTIDLRDLLIPWEKCLGVEPGAVDPKIVAVMEQKDYDFAPVFQPVKSGRAVLGLVSREQLRKLMSNGLELVSNDEGISCPAVYDRTSMSVLLDAMASNPAAIVVVNQGEYGPAPLGLLTRSDLNKHPFRAVLYSLLADLETTLARIVRDSFSDLWEWLSRLNEEKQARIVGYWEISKRRGVDIGPVGATTLAELLAVIARSEEIRSALGFNSRNAFEDAVGRIPDLRNQIMHPVRPLITDAESLVKLKEDIRISILLAQGLKELRSLV